MFKDLDAEHDTLNGHTDVVCDLEIDKEGCLYSASGDHTIVKWNLEDGGFIRHFKGHTDWVKAISLLDDKLISCSLDSTIRVWDKVSGKCLLVLSGHEEGVTSIQVVNKQMLASGSVDAKIKIWFV